MSSLLKKRKSCHHVIDDVVLVQKPKPTRSIEVIHRGPRSFSVPLTSIDDGYLTLSPGMIILNRYKVMGFLGKGTYAYVYHCLDDVLKLDVAIKVIRDLPKYRDAAVMEIKILETIKTKDIHDTKHCLKIISHFEFKSHICLVFDLFDASLLDFLKSNKFRGFAVPHIKVFAKYILQSVQFLHSLNIIHTDIKLENLMLENSESVKLYIDTQAESYVNIPKFLNLRLIDFGSSIFENAHHPSLVSTRHYRAPEIILGYKYTKSIDIFSIGCVLVELYTGKLLFETHSDLEHLKLMETIIGTFPQSLRSSPKFFNEHGTVNFIASVNGTDALARGKPLKSVLGSSDELFLDFLYGLLNLDPTLRPSANVALQHPFLN